MSPLADEGVQGHHGTAALLRFNINKEKNMARCVGQASGVSRGVVLNRSDVFVTSDRNVRIHLSKDETNGRVVTLEGDIDLLLDMAHQLLSAAQRIREIDVVT